MPGGKKNTVYRRKRKGKPFTGVQRYARKAKKMPRADREVTNSASSSSCDEALSDAESASISASRLKMRPEDSPDSSSKISDVNDFQGEGYRLVDLKKLYATLSEAHVCEEGSLTLKENSSGRNGLMADLSVECSSCLEATPLKTSDTITKKGQSFDVNRRAVYHSLETGGGYEGLVTFCSIMNMPCLSLPAYYKQVDTILEALEAEAKDEMTQAGIRVREYILKESGDEVNDDVVDAAVSFDGTWAKRGFTSLTGVVFVISVDTGEVLDYHVLSKECRKCTMKRSRCQTDEEFEAWQIEHLASNECDINFNGSSPAMEAEGAIVVWSRSVELHKIRYKWMVSDGDSKAFNTVENIYGDDCKVEKLDCVGHVQKRMGKHLLNLKARTKGKLADGKPIGATQNRNECINGLVWARCPKHKHHGAKVIRCAVASTVCHFHSGAASRARIMQRLAIPAGEYTQKASEEKDKRRLRKSDLQTSAKEKKRRQGEQMRRTRREDALREADGDTYEPGGF